MFELLKKVFAKKEQINAKEMLLNGALLIDVRSPREFSEWHAKQAKNIPLNRIHENITYFKRVNKPILLCCASGVRSAQARYILNSNNITDVHDAGSCKKFIN